MVDGLHVIRFHLVKVEPRHRRSRLERARPLDPLILVHVVDVVPQIYRVGCSPWATPSESVALEPLILRHIVTILVTPAIARVGTDFTTDMDLRGGETCGGYQNR